MSSIEEMQSASYKCISEIQRTLDNMNLDSEDYYKIDDFINGNVDFQSIRESVSKIKNMNKKFHPMYLGPVMDKILIEGEEELYERVVLLFLSFGCIGYIETLCWKKEKNTAYKIFSIGLKNNVDVAVLMNYINEIIERNIYIESKLNEMSTVIDLLIRERKAEVVENISNMNVEMRCRCLKSISHEESEENVHIIVEYLRDTSKIVRQAVVEILRVKYSDLVLEKVNSKKLCEREAAVQILNNYLHSSIDESIKNKIQHVLKSTFEKEKNLKLKKNIAAIINIEVTQNEVTNEELVSSMLKGNRKLSLKWLEFENLPKVKLKDQEEECSEDYLKALLLCYSNIKDIGHNMEGDKLADSLDKVSLSYFADEVLHIWIDKGADAKKKYVLSFTSLYGSKQRIIMFMDAIKKWSESSRKVIACDAVKAVALKINEDVLKAIYIIFEEFKAYAVRCAAQDVLIDAAKEMKSGFHELCDKLVPTLGFGINGEKIFDYGTRKFIVKIGLKNKLEVYGENNKKYKI